MKQIERKKIIIGSILILLLILSLTGILSKIFEIVIHKHLRANSLAYIKESYETSKKLFLSLSIIKATMGVIEGSTVNANAVVGVNLEMGDVIEPIYDMVNILWKISLISVILLKIQTLYFELFTVKLSSILMTVSLATFTPYYFSKNKITTIFLKVSKYILYTFLFIYILVPFAMFGSGVTAKFFDEKYKEPAVENITSNVGELGESAKDLFQLENEKSIFDFKGQATSYKQKMDTFTLKSSNVTESIAEDVPVVIGVIIFGYIIMPLLIIFFLYKFVKIFISSKLNRS